ncbi:MAG: PilZ domain-containing protein [Treponema sp.]|nr:PilZ domain-containing protein [Treponema sp.]
MYILIAVILLASLTIITMGLYSVFKTKINFFVTGLDSKFTFSDLSLLWSVAQICELENPTSLFFSMASLTKCMTQINTKAAQDGSSSATKTQQLLTKLYNYRTKLQNESDDKKGITDTRSLERGQKLRIILPGKGVFVSEVLNNGKEIIISVPRQKDLIPITAEAWVGNVINVYLWRKADARYVFDTTVTGHGLFIGESSLSLKHSNNLIRTQKRKAVRAKCDIKAMLYIIREAVVDYNTIQTKDGYKCLVEDISEAGALIRIGGKGVSNVQVSLQFTIQNMLIVMYGVIRTAEYDEQNNQSLLHFECVHLNQEMKNQVLSYVYNTMSQAEKEVYDALTLTDADQNTDSDKSNDQMQVENSENNKTEANSVTNESQSNLLTDPELLKTEEEAPDVTTQPQFDVEEELAIFDDNK